MKATDYSGYGFDRGHNCPSADRTATLDDNSATFVMSNMDAPGSEQPADVEQPRRLLPQAGKPGQQALHYLW